MPIANVHTYNLDVLTNEDALSFYLLGVMCSDGNINVIDGKKYSCSISSKDKKWLESIRDVLAPSINIRLRKNCYELDFYRKNVTDWFIKFGCKQNKSITLEFPNIPSCYNRDFIRGVFDGDGSIIFIDYKKRKNGKEYNYKKLQSYICTGSSKFANSLHDCFVSYGLNSLNRTMQTKGNYIKRCDGPPKWIGPSKIYRVIFNDKNAIQFLKFIYYDPQLLCLDRKRNVATGALSFYNVLESKRLAV